MTQTTDTDLRELRDLILSLDKKMDVYIAQSTEQFKNIDNQFKNMETRLSDFKESTDTQFSDIKKSMDTQFSDIKKSTDTQFSDIKKSTDTQFSDIRVQLRAQDNRVWGFIATLSITIIGLLSKLAFFPKV